MRRSSRRSCSGSSSSATSELGQPVELLLARPRADRRAHVAGCPGRSRRTKPLRQPRRPRPRGRRPPRTRASSARAARTRAPERCARRAGQLDAARVASAAEPGSLEHVERGQGPVDVVRRRGSRSTGGGRRGGGRARAPAGCRRAWRSSGQGGGSSARQLRAHVQVAEPVRAAQPLLARGGVEVAAERAPRRPARRRGPGRRRAAPARRSRPARRRPRPRRSARTRASRRPSRVSARPPPPGRRTATTRTVTPRRSRSAPSGASTPGCSSSLVSDLVARAEVERVEHRVDAVGGGAGERQLRRLVAPISAATRSRSSVDPPTASLEDGLAAAAVRRPGARSDSSAAS